MGKGLSSLAGEKPAPGIDALTKLRLDRRIAAIMSASTHEPLSPGEPVAITFCIPVYNDARSASLLVAAIDRVVADLPYRFEVVLVDDGSLPEECAALPNPSAHLSRVEVLSLRRNVGHQRAIAIGLAAIAATKKADYVVVMDGDGEDTPESLPHLLAAAIGQSSPTAVFAQRLKRQADLAFIAGYQAFRMLHQILVGQDIRIGNFSVLPRSILERVVGVPEIWNHYAAGVVHARIPVERVSITRGTRLAGRSKMNLPALVMHGICALSVWSDVIVARMFLVVAGLMTATLGLLFGVVAARAFSTSLVPVWATVVAGMSVVVVLLLGIICLLLALFVLGSRSSANFLPHRDWRDYVLDRPEARVTGGLRSPG